MFDYFSHFAAKGNHPDKRDILKLEKTIAFLDETEIKVDWMIQEAIAYASEKYNRPIGIRINRFNQPVVEYLMESIKNDWLLRKEKVCLETKHSSYYIFLDNIETHQYDSMVEDESYGVCGGSFPLIVNDEMIGSVTCTGLRPNEDHDVVITILKKMKEENK